MPDYKNMYIELLHEVEETIQKLIEAEKKCEEIYIETSQDK